MKTIIVEDEKSNSKRLISLLNKIDKNLEILAVLESVEDSLNWFNNNPEPDLIFMDVQLSDGTCFDIFLNYEISTPIIFTTAFDEYAIKAFKVNSVDYLLKPINPSELEQSIIKFKKLHTSGTQEQNLQNLFNYIKSKNSDYKTRFLVKKGNSFESIETTEISCFYIENQLLYILTVNGNKYLVDSILDEVESSVDPDSFFRINRQMLVNISLIKQVKNHPGNRLIITPSVPFEKEIIVSREKVSLFKKWLDK